MTKKKILTTKTPQPLHKPHYDITKASEIYANIAAVLAGFAFTAVVLLAQSTLTIEPHNNYLYEQVTTSFLLALAGCIVAAVVFSIITGEEEFTARSYAIGFWASIGFSISVTYLFFGLVILAKLFLSTSNTIENFTLWLFGGVIWMSLTYVIMSVFDPIIRFDNIDFDNIPNSKRIWFFLSGYLPLVIGLIAKFVATIEWRALLNPFYNSLLITSFIFIIVGAGWGLLIGSSSHEYRINSAVSVICLILQSVISALLFLII